MIVVLFLLLLCASFIYSVCACSRELGERHASCNVVLSMLLQLRLLRLLRVLVRTVAAAAAAADVCCHGFFEVGLPEAVNNHYETIGQPVEWSPLDL